MYATNLFRQESPLGQPILIAKHEFEVVEGAGKTRRIFRLGRRTTP